MNNNIDLMDAIPVSKKNTSNITVIGVGGGGSNAVEYMYNQGINDVEFMICNTDLQALNSKNVPMKLMIGESVNHGLGAGADPQKGEDAALEDEDRIKEILLAKNTQMVFITAGMGGGTGTGASPVIARIARNMGLLVVGIVTMPLKSEGRIDRAKAGLAKLKQHLDAILVIDNDMVLKIYNELTWEEAFHKADDILATGARSLAEILVNNHYHFNVDLNDVIKTMRDTGFFLMGTSTEKSSSETVVDDLINSTLQSPLLMQNDISGAKNILLSLTNGVNGFSAGNVDQILYKIQEMTDGEAEMIIAIGKDVTLAPDEVKLIIVATGFESEKFKTYDKNVAKVLPPKPISYNARTLVDLVPVDEVEIGNFSEEQEFAIFENEPAYKRVNRDIFHYIDPLKKKVVKIKSN